VVQILLGVAHHHRFAGGAAGGVQAGDALARHRQQAKRVVVAQVGFGHERKQRQVRQLFQVIRVHPLGLAALAVGGDMVVAVAQRPFQALQLQGGDFVAAGGLDRVELAGLGQTGGHGEVS